MTDIVEQVVREGQVKRGEVEEDVDSEEEDTPRSPCRSYYYCLTRREVIELVQRLEHLTIRSLRLHWNYVIGTDLSLSSVLASRKVAECEASDLMDTIARNFPILRLY